MNKTSSVHARMDDQVKNDALKVFDTLGISVSEAITLFFRQVALKNGIPFELNANSVKKSAIEYVSDFKKEDLRKVLDVIPESVDELWVFGSSVTPYCKPDSDLDVCIVGHTTMEEEKKIYNAADCAVDIITETPEGFEKAKGIKGSIYKEVVDKGILVYKKGER